MVQKESGESGGRREEGGGRREAGGMKPRRNGVDANVKAISQPKAGWKNQQKTMPTQGGARRRRAQNEMLK